MLRRSTLIAFACCLLALGAVATRVSHRRERARNLKKKSSKSSDSDMMTFADLLNSRNNSTDVLSSTNSSSSSSNSKKGKGKKKDKSKKETKSKKSKKSTKSEKKRKSKKAKSSKSSLSGSNSTAAPLTNATMAPMASQVTASPAAMSVVTSAPSSPSSSSKKKKKSKGSKSNKKRLKGRDTSIPATSTAPSVSSVPTEAPIPTVSPRPTATPVTPSPSMTPELTLSPVPLLEPTAPTSSQPLGGLPTTPLPSQETTSPLFSVGTLVPSSSPVVQPSGDLPVPTSESTAPTNAPFSLAPAIAPASVAPFPAETAEPTPFDPLVRVGISQFTVQYSLTGVSSNPTAEQMEEAVRITLTFLNDYLADVFEANDTPYDSLLGTRTSSTPDSLQIEYIAAARFLRSSNFIPTTAELDILVTTAFSQPSVQTLLILLRNLPIDNPYSSTTEVIYATGSLQSSNQRSSGVGAGGIAGITSAFLAAFVITGAAAAYRRGSFDKVAYAKAPSYDKIHHVVDFEKSHQGADEVSMSTSSISSPPASHAGGGDGEYCSRIIDQQDIEIKFFRADNDMSSDDSSTTYDPLFQAPFAAAEEERRRENV